MTDTNHSTTVRQLQSNFSVTINNNLHAQPSIYIHAPNRKKHPQLLLGNNVKNCMCYTHNFYSPETVNKATMN